MKKIILSLTILIHISVRGQISYPVPNYYGWSYHRVCSAPFTYAGNTVYTTGVNTSLRATVYTPPSLIITKKGNENYTFNVFSNGCPNTPTPSFCNSSSSTLELNNRWDLKYAEISDMSRVLNVTNTSVGIAGAEGFSGNTYTPASDASFFSAALSNSTIASNGVCRYFRMTNTSEYTVNIKFFALDNYSCHSSTASPIYGFMTKYLFTSNFISTNPNNWTPYSCTDADWVASNSLNAVSKTTRYAYLRNYTSGTFSPQSLLTNLPHGSVWDSITSVQLIYNNYAGTGTWSYVAGGANLKTGIDYSSIPTNTRLIVRYWYRLADDPSSTSGAREGYLDVNCYIGNATIGSSSGCWGCPSNPFTVCKDQGVTNLSWFLGSQTALNNTHINLPYPNLYTGGYYSYSGPYLSGANNSNFNSNGTPRGIYSINCSLNYDNGTENFTVLVHVADTPLVFSSTYFKYGDGSLTGSLGNQLEICQNDASLDNTTLENIFWSSNTSSYYGATQNNSDFSTAIRIGSKTGSFVANSISSSKLSKFNFSSLTPGDYYVEFFNPGASANNTINTLCGNGYTYFFKVVVKVNVKPSIGVDRTFCQNDAAYTMIYTPLGGSFATNIVTGFNSSTASFNPATSPLGQSIVYYTINNGNGCINKDTVVYSVLSSPKPSIGSDLNLCSNAPQISLNPTIAGGSFNSVTGLVGNVFTPTISNLGIKEIIYSIVHSNGCTNKDTAIYTVFSNPKPSLGVDQSFCQFTSSNFTIPNSPVGGIFKTPAGGIVAGLTGSTYNATVAGVGANTLIYEVNNSNGCLNYDTVVYTTYSNPKPSIGTDQNFCSHSSAYTIPNTPTGGMFNAVAGLIGNVFTPSTATLGNSSIYYVVNNGNGCVNSDTAEFTIHSKPNTPSYTKTFDSVCTIQGSMPSNIQLKSFFTISTVSGITENWYGASQSGGVVDIHSLIPGQTYSFLFVQTNNFLCKDSSYFRLKSLNGSNNVLQFTKAFDTICHSLSSIDLQNYNLTVRNGFWTYSPNPSFIQNNKDLLVNLLPLEQIVSLIYAADTSGCRVSKTLSLIRSKPSVSAGIDKNLCSNGMAEVLTGTPSGGSWTIDTLRDIVTVFNPAKLSMSQSSLAKNYSLFYTRNINGCLATDTAVYTIIKKPTVSFVKNSDSVCIGRGTIDLTIHFGVNPTNGIWKGSNLNQSILDLLAAGVGTANPFYIIQNSFGCLDTSYYALRVDDNHSNGLLDTLDYKVCEASGPIRLNQFKTSVSKGIWTGASVIDTLFYPTSTGVGNFSIQYATQNKSCPIELRKKLWVVARPAIPDLIGTKKYCKNSLFNISIKNPDPILSYQWHDGSNSFSGVNFVGKITEDLNLVVIALNYLNCESFKANYSLSLDEPSASIFTDRDTVMNGKEIFFGLNNPIHIASARWNFGDGAEGFDSMNISRIYYNPSTIQSQNYLVECEIKSETGCVSKLNRMITVLRRTSSILDPGQGQDADTGQESISLFPNPASEYIEILRGNLHSAKPSLPLSIFDLTGRILYSDQVGHALRIDVSEFPVGVYFVRIGEKETIQLIIEK